MKNTVIFDLDGTLLDTLEDLFQSATYAQRKLGYPEHTRKQVRSHVGNGLKVLMRESLPAGSSEEEIEEAYLLCQKYYGEHSNDATKPYDGIIELLECLKNQHFKMAIVSNKPDFAVKSLNKIFFSDYIEVAIGENESAGIQKKPAPDTVLTALKELNSSLDESVYVGDSEVDLKTAENCDMDLIMCEWGFRDKEDMLKEGAKVFARAPQDILDILRQE